MIDSEEPVLVEYDSEGDWRSELAGANTRWAGGIWHSRCILPEQQQKRS